MKAVVLMDIDKLEFRELELPKLKSGQVLVKILYSGICHTQINEIKGNKGEDRYLPHLIGHEGSGIVEKVGPDVTKVKEGDYVVLTWIKGSGKDVASSQYISEGVIINSGAVTTFSEYSVVSENRLVPIDTNVPPDVAALLGCAIPTGAGIIKNEIKSQKGTLAIFGMGGIGASALIYTASLNYDKIIAVDINQAKLDFAKEIGATHTINSAKEDPVEAIKKIGYVDYAVECSGVKAVMEQAIASIHNKGKVVIAGNPRIGTTISVDPYDLIKGKKIVGTWGGATDPDKDIPHYANLIMAGRYNVARLISKIYPFDKINDAISDLSEGRVVRALIKINGQ